MAISPCGAGTHARDCLRHITPKEQPEFFVGSLIMAKVVLLIDSFFKIRREPGRPLIYGTLWNTGLYFVAAMVLHHVEHMITLIRHRHVGFAEANREAFLGLEKPTFVAIMIGVTLPFASAT